MLALAAVLLLLIAAKTASERADAEPGEGVILDIVYAFAEALLGGLHRRCGGLGRGRDGLPVGLPPRRQDHLPRSDLQLGGGGRGGGRGPRGVHVLSMLGGTRPALGLF